MSHGGRVTEPLQNALLKQPREKLAIVPFDARACELAVVGHTSNDELVNVAAQEDRPLERDVGARKAPADFLQAFDEPDDDEGIEIAETDMCPEPVEVVEQEEHYPL